MFYDYIIRNASIVDGTGSEAYTADVAVKDDIIVKIGTIEEKAETEIDASGLTLTPGFIDTHSHTEVALFSSAANQRIVQGVTTEICCHCGPSPAPVREDRKDLLRRIYFDLTGLGDEFEWTWSDFAGWIKAVEDAKPSGNYAFMVGHGTIRAYVMGDDTSKASPEQLSEMKSVLDKALSEGAIGMGMGIQFFPGNSADEEEMVELAKVVKDHDGIISVHRRNEDVVAVESVDEMLNVAEKSGVKMNIAHVKVMGKKYWGKSKTIIDHIEKSIERGGRISMDAYPWTGGFTQLYKMLDPAIWKEGPEEMKRRLKDPAVRQQLIDDTMSGKSGTMMTANGEADGIMVIQIPDDRYNKKTLKQISDETGINPVEVAIRLIENYGNDISMFPFYQSQEELDDIMMYKDCLVMSDAVPSLTYPHPRHMGTFSHYLDRYVKQLKRISLEEAINRITSRPAKLYKLGNRGEIKEGMKADMVLFDWNSFTNTTTYAEPMNTTEAIKYVFVNGKLAAKDGVYTGAGSGEVIKSTDN